MSDLKNLEKDIKNTIQTKNKSNIVIQKGGIENYGISEKSNRITTGFITLMAIQEHGKPHKNSKNKKNKKS